VPCRARAHARGGCAARSSRSAAAAGRRSPRRGEAARVGRGRCHRRGDRLGRRAGSSGRTARPGGAHPPRRSGCSGSPWGSRRSRCRWDAARHRGQAAGAAAGSRGRRHGCGWRAGSSVCTAVPRARSPRGDRPSADTARTGWWAWSVVAVHASPLGPDRGVEVNNGGLLGSRLAGRGCFDLASTRVHQCGGSPIHHAPARRADRGARPPPAGTGSSTSPMNLLSRTTRNQRCLHLPKSCHRPGKTVLLTSRSTSVLHQATFALLMISPRRRSAPAPSSTRPS
jgi:hypothetical protein